MVTSLDDVTSVFVVIVVCGVVGDMVVIIDSDEFRNVVLFEEFVKIADSVEFTLKDAEFDILVVINMFEIGFDVELVVIIGIVNVEFDIVFVESAAIIFSAVVDFVVSDKVVGSDVVL